MASTTIMASEYIEIAPGLIFISGDHGKKNSSTGIAISLSAASTMMTAKSIITATSPTVLSRICISAKPAAIRIQLHR
jgi:hypothetical protein